MSGQPNPLDVLREATAFRNVAALKAYPTALAQVETLVGAAKGVRDTWKAYPREGWAIGDMLSLETALGPFVGQPGDDAT